VLQDHRAGGDRLEGVGDVLVDGDGGEGRTAAPAAAGALVTREGVDEGRPQEAYLVGRARTSSTVAAVITPSSLVLPC
jgi:hypothetical protein